MADRAAELLLCDSAAAGDATKVSTLLAAGADPAFFNSGGMTPLMHAARHGRAAAVRLLLDAGAGWNALSPSGLSAGDLAMTHAHGNALDLLLDAAVRAELVLGRAAAAASAPAADRAYLTERVAFGEDRIVDAESKAVMMAWERPLMDLVSPTIGLRGGDTFRERES